jgi:hypothetical protein
MTTVRTTLAALSAVGLMASACTTTGVGTGASRGGNVTAQFSWKESGAQKGEMTAVLGTGETYSGQFFQITDQTQVDTLGPLWTGWGGGFGRRGFGRGGFGPEWDYWGPQPTFVTHYSGKVVANLQGPGGYMRCTFQLANPSSGMNAGGSGRCQLPAGQTIDATFSGKS